MDFSRGVNLRKNMQQPLAEIESVKLPSPKRSQAFSPPSLDSLINKAFG